MPPNPSSKNLQQKIFSLLPSLQTPFFPTQQLWKAAILVDVARVITPFLYRVSFCNAFHSGVLLG